MENNCRIHNTPWKEVPAGISKTSGKPYNAFKVCSTPNCNEKPARVFTQQLHRPQGLPPRPAEFIEATSGYVKPEPTLGFSRAEIDEWLKKLPSLISRQAEMYNEARRELDEAKHDLKVQEAICATEHSKDDLNANEKEATVIMDDTVQGLETVVIGKEAEVRSEQIKMDELTNKFDALRKAASIIIAEMSHMKEAV